jgi:hypothetical protein
VARPVPDLQVAPQVRDLSRALLPDADALGAQMADRILAEIPLYAEGKLVPFDQLTASCGHNTRYVLGRLAGQPRVNVAAPRATGITRAEQGVPYSAVLQAFRVGSRFLWELLVERAAPADRDELLMAAADIWAVSDELASQVTEAYRTALADRVRRDGQMRGVLVSGLLDGNVSAAEELVEAAAALHLERSGEFVVVSAHCPAPGAEGLPDVEPMLRRHNVTSAWRLDHEHQDGLVELRPGFSTKHLVGVLEEPARGRVGVSTVFPVLADAPEARREARLACQSATPGSQEVVRFDQRPLAVLLASAPDQAAGVAAAVLGPVLSLQPEDRKVLLETARTWLAAEGSTSTAAQQLHLHRNTVRYRLLRLEELTGRDLAKPSEAAEVLVALECVRILGL